MKSIHFTPEEITQILKGEKTQCRKVIKPLKTIPIIDKIEIIKTKGINGVLATNKQSSPYKIDEVIYCKEPWNNCMADIVTYKTVDNDAWWTLWSPAITMPEWASRCKIRITDIRAERYNEKYEYNGKGINRCYICGKTIYPYDGYHIKKDGVSCNECANENIKKDIWYWIYTFEVIK